MSDRPPLPAALRARVLDAARREPASTRARSQRDLVATTAAGFAASVATFFALGGAQLGPRPPAFVAVSVMGWVALAALATWGGLGRGGSMLGRPSTWLVLIAALTGPTFLAWLFLGTSISPEMREPPGDAKQHLGCFLATALLAVFPFVALVFVRRGSDPVHPRKPGAVVGAISGAWAGVMIDLHCPVSSAFHVAVSHVLPIVVFTLLGALIGNALLGLRQTRSS